MNRASARYSIVCLACMYVPHYIVYPAAVVCCVRTVSIHEKFLSSSQDGVRGVRQQESICDPDQIGIPNVFHHFPSHLWVHAWYRPPARGGTSHARVRSDVAKRFPMRKKMVVILFRIGLARCNEYTFYVSTIQSVSILKTHTMISTTM